MNPFDIAIMKEGDLANYPASFVRRFWKFHIENPHIYRLFEEYAIEAKKRGVQRSSMELFCNLIRWERPDVTTFGSEVFKINENYKAAFARMILLCHPELTGLLRFRTIRMRDIPSREEAARRRGETTETRKVPDAKEENAQCALPIGQGATTGQNADV